MTLKSEILALSFGALIILITFGDAFIYPNIGNLDTIFGLRFWQALDIFYPLAAISVFLLYGWVNGKRLIFNRATVFFFASFILGLVLVNIDDFIQVLNLAFDPSKTYWVIIMWVYPLYSAVAFVLFGKIHRIKVKKT